MESMLRSISKFYTSICVEGIVRILCPLYPPTLVEYEFKYAWVQKTVMYQTNKYTDHNVTTISKLEVYGKKTSWKRATTEVHTWIQLQSTFANFQNTYILWYKQ